LDWTMIKRIGAQKAAWTGLRFLLAWTFLWAFFDKLLGLGHETDAEGAWINGGSPTEGYLLYATSGPLSDFYQSLSGNGAMDAVFMGALLLLGIALTLGIGLKVAGYGGALFMIALWSSRLPPENNPISDDHIIYALVLIGIAYAGVGEVLGLGRWWKETAFVKRLRFME